MIGMSGLNSVSGVPSRNAGPTDLHSAALTLAGEQPVGVPGEARAVLSLVVTNGGASPVWVQAESESTKESVSLTVQPGQTGVASDLSLAIQAYWNGAARPAPRWDGVNLRWKEPA
jgi:hypothetical protein